MEITNGGDVLTASFNLVDEPWIPCLDQGEIRDLSLANVFLRGHELADVVDPSPLVTAALYRFLLAVAHSAFRPLGAQEWEEFWAAGRWPSEAVGGYLTRWHSRFDLFDPERPFYQVPRTGFSPYLEKYEKGVEEITHEWGAANFDMFAHTRDDFTLTRAGAARYLVCWQAFCSGGLHTHEEGKQADKYVRDAPMARTAMCVLRGASLFETLMLNMVDYLPEDDLPFQTLAEDQPAWEADTYATVVERRPLGYLDWLTWQSRRILLVPEMLDGRAGIARTVVMKGAQLPAGVWLQEYEQLAAFWRLDKAKPDQDPAPSVSFDGDRALWRDSVALLTGETTEAKRRGVPPKSLVSAGDRPIHDPAAYGLTVLGALFKRGQVNVLLWRRESLPVPLLYVENKDLQSRLREALAFAEDVAYALRESTKTFAKFLLAPAAGEDGGRSGDPGAIRALAEGLGTGTAYWGALENHFRRFLTEQALARWEIGGAVAYSADPLRTWAAHVVRAAWLALETATETEQSGRGLKAAVEASGEMARRIGKIRTRLPQITEEEAQYAVPAN